MGPPTVVCDICKQTVLKARTRHIGDGKRACTEHPGIQEQATKVQANVAQKLVESRKPKRLPHREQEIPSLQPSCAICGVRGLREDEFYLKMAIASKQLQLKGEDCLFDTDALHKQMKLSDVTHVIRVYAAEMLDQEQTDRVLSQTKPDLRFLLRDFGLTGICLHCVDELQLPEPVRPELDMKELFMLGALVDPVLTEIAQKTM